MQQASDENKPVSEYVWNSRPLDVWRREQHPIALQRAKRVVQLLKDASNTPSNGEQHTLSPPLSLPGNQKRGFSKFENHLKRVLWDLIVSRYDWSGEVLDDADIPWLGVRLSNRVAQRNDSRYNAIHWKPATLRMVVDALEACNLIHRKPGFIDHETGIKFCTRIKGTATLWSMVDGVTPDMLRWDESEQTIRIKDDGKQAKLTEYQDEDEPRIRQWRKTVDLINAKMQDTRIALPLTQADMDQIDKDRTQKGKNPVNRALLVPSQLRLYRQFKGDWYSGGRFYGSWFQNIPSEARRFITINGERTVEIDYSSLHPVLLYADGGLPITGDPYALPDVSDEERGKLKLIFQFMVNGKSKRGAKQTAAQHPKVGPGYGHLVDLMEQHHATIKAHFYQDGAAGKLLQFRDSQIAEAVMQSMWSRDLPVLPIHDSFVTPERWEEFLWGAMDSALHNFEPALHATGYGLFKLIRSDGSKEMMTSRMGLERHRLS